MLNIVLYIIILLVLYNIIYNIYYYIIYIILYNTYYARVYTCVRAYARMRVRVSVGSICNTISKADIIFDTLIDIYYLATVCNYKAVFIMTNSCELKVGGAGSNSPA